MNVKTIAGETLGPKTKTTWKWVTATKIACKKLLTNTKPKSWMKKN